MPKESKVVWAKFDEYPYWPARMATDEITETLRDQYNRNDGVGVLFFGPELSYALVDEENIKEYKEYFFRYGVLEDKDFLVAVEQANKAETIEDPPLDIPNRKRRKKSLAREKVISKKEVKSESSQRSNIINDKEAENKDDVISLKSDGDNKESDKYTDTTLNKTQPREGVITPEELKGDYNEEIIGNNKEDPRSTEINTSESHNMESLKDDICIEDDNITNTINSKFTYSDITSGEKENSENKSIHDEEEENQIPGLETNRSCRDTQFNKKDDPDDDYNNSNNNKDSNNTTANYMVNANNDNTDNNTNDKNNTNDSATLKNTLNHLLLNYPHKINCYNEAIKSIERYSLEDLLKLGLMKNIYYITKLGIKYDPLNIVQKSKVIMNEYFKLYK
ncbi:hypothetical protein TCON_0058 [Astathelohania contejeani]|uniref:PWWP domain-containing protein n=1 Tax=Astathelohania contejeani TaxID=164912 RepID=A0ABQ7I2Y5_9MICR|nr:hypothetical protein TCON_0058 [Thelohania contejeani]